MVANAWNMRIGPMKGIIRNYLVFIVLHLKSIFCSVSQNWNYQFFVSLGKFSQNPETGYPRSLNCFDTYIQHIINLDQEIIKHIFSGPLSFCSYFMMEIWIFHKFLGYTAIELR